MKKTVLAATTLLLTSMPLMSEEARRSPERSSNVETTGDRDARADRTGSPSENDFRDRMADAIETVEAACAADINLFCRKVTPGEGRLAFCIRAHEDQLARTCRRALRQVARNVGEVAERIAETCWNEVRALCGESDKMGQCVAQKKGSLSSSCATIVTSLGQKVQELIARPGMPVYGPDGKSIGQVAEVLRGEDGKIQSIQVDIGRILGIGSKLVAIGADKIELLAGVKVLLSEGELRSLPEAKPDTKTQ